MSRKREVNLKKEKYKTVITVAKAAVRKGVHNPHQLHLRTGISIPRSNKLWNGSGKIELDDISKICNFLPCKIKDIFQLVPFGEQN